MKELVTEFITSNIIAVLMIVTVIVYGLSGGMDRRHVGEMSLILILCYVGSLIIYGSYIALLAIIM